MFCAQKGKKTTTKTQNTFLCVPHYSPFTLIVKERTATLKIHCTAPVSFRDKMCLEVKKHSSYYTNLAPGGKPALDLERKFVEILT